ncbi:hypothetical protein AMTR_s00086p00153510 [Amborella trichopoda]|uniref:Uncharacterized protein n=1 Tax=Amborella trichopoda TaxID=13333 RepID=W1P5A7_AMBTC|nr:hypothetical protein AMTR_s00086p00153510 [Amborella trichopoda]
MCLFIEGEAQNYVNESFNSTKQGPGPYTYAGGGFVDRVRLLPLVDLVAVPPRNMDYQLLVVMAEKCYDRVTDGHTMHSSTMGWEHALPWGGESAYGQVPWLREILEELPKEPTESSGISSATLGSFSFTWLVCLFSRAKGKVAVLIVTW